MNYEGPIETGPEEQRHFCQALSPEGELCKHLAKYAGYYHGEDGLYYDMPEDPNCVAWVLVELCEKHADATFGYRKRGQTL
jgi:hypothetical protein